MSNYEEYAASKLIVAADPTLTPRERAERISELTDELWKAEAALGIVWRPVAAVTVEEATDSGSVPFPRKEIHE